jgi:hypothetical protein
MNDSIDTDGADASKAFSVPRVQTSALLPAEVVHQEPTTGGSYIRNLDTGTITKVDGPADDDQE